jgi:hypothetical protein
MIRISTVADTFEILDGQTRQNPYFSDTPMNKKKAIQQHKKLETSLSNMLVYKPTQSEGLGDFVFIASAGLCLPRLGVPVFILPWMKYPQRRKELPSLLEMFKLLKLRTVPFPGSADAPFEGQAEVKWFHGGTKMIHGYGYRSTAKSCDLLEKLIMKIYKAYGVTPPEILQIPIQSFDYYHMDLAMLEYDDEKCIVQKSAFSSSSIEKIKAFLGADSVNVIDEEDKFCLNAIVDDNKLITHKLKGRGLWRRLEKITGKTIKEIDTSEFEKSGGSIRCMVLDIFN